MWLRAGHHLSGEYKIFRLPYERGLRGTGGGRESSVSIHRNYDGEGEDKVGFARKTFCESLGTRPDETRDLARLL